MQENCDFLFLMNAKNKLIVGTEGMMDFLGYKESLSLSNKFWRDIILHPQERSNIINLDSFISEWHEGKPINKVRFIINHKMRKSDGSYIQVLRIVFPYQKIHNDNMEGYWVNICFDINHTKPSKAFSFDVKCSELSDTQLADLKKTFQKKTHQKNLFTTRELQIIESWSKMDSIQHIYLKFGISTRTVETHLKNMRKKANVNKTRDVLEIVKRNGYIN